MTAGKYQQFWENIFSVRATELTQKFPCLKFDSAKKDEIWTAFEQKKPDLKQFMQNPDGLLDRHKVAALFIDVILAKRPFTTTAKSAESIKGRNMAEFAPNEAWAWFCAKDIVYSFIHEKNKKSGDERLIRIWNTPFINPPCDHGTYDEHVYRSLALSTVKRTFDIFSFSQILFFLEKYTLKSREQQFLAKIP